MYGPQTQRGEVTRKSKEGINESSREGKIEQILWVDLGHMGLGIKGISLGERKNILVKTIEIGGHFRDEAET